MQSVPPQKTVHSGRRLSSVGPAVGLHTQGTEGFVHLGWLSVAYASTDHCFLRNHIVEIRRQSHNAFFIGWLPSSRIGTRSASEQRQQGMTAGISSTLCFLF